jgi:hypothetical protein
MATFHPRPVLLLLWIAAAVLFALSWLAGIGWGITSGFRTWTYFALPLFLITELAIVPRWSKNIMILAIWLALLGVGHLDAEFLGGDRTLVFQVVAVMIVVFSTLLPPWIIFRAVRRIQRMSGIQVQQTSALVTLLLVAFVAGVSWVAYDQLRPPDQFVVYFRSEATAAEVEEVWRTILMKEAEKMRGSTFIDGVDGVTADTEGPHRTLIVSLSPGASRQEKRRVLELLRRSPSVVRAERMREGP